MSCAFAFCIGSRNAAPAVETQSIPGNLPVSLMGDGGAGCLCCPILTERPAALLLRNLERLGTLAARAPGPPHPSFVSSDRNTPLRNGSEWVRGYRYEWKTRPTGVVERARSGSELEACRLFLTWLQLCGLASSDLPCPGLRFIFFEVRVLIS